MHACPVEFPRFAVLVIATFLAFGATPPAAHAEDDAVSAMKADAALSAESLLREFSRMPGLEARFVEEKTLAMLAAPLESRGTLYYAPPGYMLRRIDEPRRSEVLVTPDRLVVTEGGAVVQQFDLNARSEVSTFVESFVWILAGDIEKLRSAYELRFAAGEAATETATPSDEARHDDDATNVDEGGADGHATSDASTNVDEGGADGHATSDASTDVPWSMTLSPRDERLAHVIRSITVKGVGLSVVSILVSESNGDQTLTRILDANPARTFSDAEHRRLFGRARE